MMMTSTITRGLAAAGLLGLGLLGFGCKSESTALAALPPGASAGPTGQYCNLGVFTPTEWQRHKALVPQLAAATTERQELEDGYLFRFSGQFKNAGEWLDGVRRCCPTIRYQVDFDPHAGMASLRVTGETGAKEFIREEFAALLGTKR
jgi:hypothetical protein